MLLSHIGFSLGLIALVFGVALYLWSVRAEAGPGLGLAKTIGIIVIVLSILDLICTVYSGVRMKHFCKELRKEDATVTAAPANSTPAVNQSLPITPNTPASTPAQ